MTTKSLEIQHVLFKLIKRKKFLSLHSVNPKESNREGKKETKRRNIKNRMSKKSKIRQKKLSKIISGVIKPVNEINIPFKRQIVKVDFFKDPSMFFLQKIPQT